VAGRPFLLIFRRLPANRLISPTKAICITITCRDSSAEPPERLKLSSSSAIRGTDTWVRCCQRV
jgi:hypothetical protein